MRRIRVRVGRKVVLVMAALPVMLMALGGVGMASEGVTDGWLHSGMAQEPRGDALQLKALETRAELQEEIVAAQRTWTSTSAVTDGWLHSVVGEHARAATARTIAAAEELAGSTDGWLHSVVGDAAREQQPVRVVSSPAQTHLPDTTLIVSVITTALLAGMGGYFLRTRLAL